MTSGSFLASLRCTTLSLPGMWPAAYNSNKVGALYEE